MKLKRITLIGSPAGLVQGPSLGSGPSAPAGHSVLPALETSFPREPRFSTGSFHGAAQPLWHGRGREGGTKAQEET